MWENAIGFTLPAVTAILESLNCLQAAFYTYSLLSASLALTRCVPSLFLSLFSHHRTATSRSGLKSVHLQTRISRLVILPLFPRYFDLRYLLFHGLISVKILTIRVCKKNFIIWILKKSTETCTAYNERIYKLRSTRKKGQAILAPPALYPWRLRGIYIGGGLSYNQVGYTAAECAPRSRARARESNTVFL